jgi:release factor glutamine methyltransferase
MVVRLLAERGLARDQDILDMFTGSGVLAISAARLGARSVTAVDVSRRALATVTLNARRNQVRVRTRRGSLFEAVARESFNVVLANPPYYPGDAELPGHGAARAWEGGGDGRALIDPLCSQVAHHLRPGGRFVIVHGSFNGEQRTLDALEDSGLKAEVVDRHRGPLGAIGRQRVARLREQGLGVTADGRDEEETILISAIRPNR